ncbi:MAG: DUF3822 family protein [Bacteroides sp.]|nr:DUF3822 family protein [Bacteroides sp.]
MNASRLTPDLAPADLTAWQLTVKVTPGALSALILGPEGPDRAVIAHSQPLADETLESLENAIYDNPLMLSDFGRVNILIASSQRVIIPDSIPESMDEEIVRTMLPDSEGPRRIISSPLPGAIRVLAAIDSETLSFIRRTFPDGKISLAIAAIANSAESLRPDGEPLNLAITEPGELCIVSLDADGRLTFANRFEVDCAPDCAYFILAALGPQARSLTIGGNADLRNETIDQLRMAAPDFEPTPLFLSPETAELRRHAETIPLDLFL